MKNTLKAIVSLVALYFIFSLETSEPMKNFLLSLVCLVIVIGSAVRGLVRGNTRRRAGLFVLPTLVYCVITALNLGLNWNVQTYALWASYLALIFVGFVVLAKFDEIPNQDTRA